MNFKIVLLIFFIISSLYAKERGSEIIFEYKTNVNYFERYLINFKRKNEILINGISLTNKEIENYAFELNLVRNFEHPKKIEECMQGEFRLHNKVEGKIIETESGCLESSRYKVLMKAFTKLMK
ncbi:MAG: hypothetical protein U0T83_01000 [Bacteriovoracaceae bacterium]